MLSSRSLKVMILGCVLFAGGCDRQSSENAQPELSTRGTTGKTTSGAIDTTHKGEPIPNLTVSAPDGSGLSLPSLAGKPLLVNLWATWCAPCVAELPTLDRIAQSRAGALRVLTVSQDSGRTEGVADFLAEKGGPHLEPWLDPESQLSFHYGTGTLPTTVLYDAAGKEVWRTIGERDWTSEDSAKLLAEGDAKGI